MENRGDVDSRAVAYRPDIDGLRAVAVSAVIVFHLAKNWLPGGYLGVDVFFVLSGFLITSIIWREVQARQFTIGQFYSRRIRRILPALFLLLLVTTPVAALLLLPADLIGYGKSLLATLGFVANIYFWRDTDYFARLAELKPLLHLWSLAVEEQFYIFFPLILLVLGRFWRRGTVPMVAALVVLSYAGNLLGIYVGGAAPSFYLFPTRAWELGIGALPALLATPLRLRGWATNLASGFGALLILGSLVNPYDFGLPVPAASAAVVGAMVVIVAGMGSSVPLVNRLLGYGPIVFVGLISYSLYLWHWPIIVYLRYYLVREPSLPQMAVAALVMVVCGYLSWRFVERPFRSRKMAMGIILLCSAAAIAVLAAAAILFVAADGLPGRLNPQAAAINEAVETNFRCRVQDYFALGSSRACAMNLPTRDSADAQVVLFGNSHAQMYTPVWASLLAEHELKGLLLPANGCLPTITVNITPDCYGVAERNLASLIGLSRASIVVIGMTWNDDLYDRQGEPVTGQRDVVLAAAVDDLVARLRRAGKRVILIGPLPMPGYDIATTLSRKLAFGHSTAGDPTAVSLGDYQAEFGFLLRHFSDRRDLVFVRPDAVQLRGGRYQFLLAGRSLFADGNHLAAAEVWRYHAMFDAALQKARDPR